MLKGKHFYLGANTPEGFFSYYDNIITSEDAVKLYCIKGGPGTGKSSFMKKIASQMISKGYHTELIHCSSDDDSLDGLLIKELKIAFTDGTAPHIRDPKYPGAVDEILNLGAFWDTTKIVPKRSEIIYIQKKISDHFDRAYDYLGAIKKFYDNNEKIHKKTYNRYHQNSFIDDILFEELSELPLTDYIGKKRKLFASAITPSGFVNRLDTILDGMKVYTLSGYIDNMLIRLADFITERGIDVEMYFCPMSPQNKCEHLVVPALNLAFTLSNKYHSYKKGEKADFSIASIGESRYSQNIEFNNNQIDEIFTHVISELKCAKDLHDKLEQLYIESMDFDAIDALSDKTAKEILEKA